MTYKEKLQWIAEHLVTFRPILEHAYMTYIDVDGFSCDVVYEHPELNPSDLELLEGCIEMALDNDEPV